MSTERVFLSKHFQQPADGEPIRSVITESEDATVVSWYVKPGQRISAHFHPVGQDTWTILAGHGQYQLNSNGETTLIGLGDVVVARRGQVHGVFNHGTEPLEFVSVVSPAASGFELLEVAASQTPTSGGEA